MAGIMAAIALWCGALDKTGVNDGFIIRQCKETAVQCMAENKWDERHVLHCLGANIKPVPRDDQY